jgi:glucokinase-like ROK family protein
MNETATSSMLRYLNRSSILRLLRREGPISRTQIAKVLNISVPTVMRIIDELMEEDLVVPFGVSHSTGGRPPSLLNFNGNGYSIVGIDLGGTKIYGAIADLSGKIQYEKYMEHTTKDPMGIYEQLCQLIQELLDAPRPELQKVRGIGIGVPGVTIIPEGIVQWAPNLGWRDFPLKKLLRERFNVPCFIENDVNLAALGEWGYGAGQGKQNIVCLMLGTGIGAGIIIEGSLYRGHNQASGEVGYLLPGVNYLGKRYDHLGALEQLAAGPGIANRGIKVMTDLSLSVPGGVITAETIFNYARKDCEWAKKVVDETVDYLSLGIASISALLDPEMIILGGGLAQSADLLIEPIYKRIDGVVPYIPQLIASNLEYRSGVMGAIMMVLNLTSKSYVVKRIPF